MRPRKILLVVLDGAGDRAVESLGHNTPLQASEHPNLDWFAENGSCGIMDTISPGVRPGSDTAHLSILGYDPYDIYTGRGPFEAAGVGIVGKKGDVAFRCNFATVDENMCVVDRRAGRIKEPDTRELVSVLEGMTIEGVDITVKEATEHRAALLLSGKGLSAHVSDVDPHQLGPIHECQPLEENAKLTARVVNEFVRRSYDKLKDHPVNLRRVKEGKPVANILLPRGSGIFPDIQPFKEKYGMKAACISGVSLIRGIGRVLDMEVIEDQRFTGGLDSDIDLKIQTALDLLDENDFVLLNVKMADIASHDSDPQQKMEVISLIDSMIGILRKELNPEMVVAITADHCTPITVGDHTGDPVPLIVWAADGVRDKVTRYDEASCSMGGLGRIRGVNLLPILLDKANRSEKYGA
ncbi:MAG: 2,3-bisphosphoglycerate-independent phosphoglycerate mutase [Methanomassiliicoccales archaeon]|nr:2,3-bisphosphoglycerate-independent phosphoglycerate mutase [Methanomassiliicoccales archaeon]NYT15821.1 2,3-bisphosphoglycerate-independent phosphoglycerate mutase [Methanomassiliicoccales archaeon]